MDNKLKEETERLKKGCGKWHQWNGERDKCFGGFLCKDCLNELDQHKKTIAIVKEMLSIDNFRSFGFSQFAVGQLANEDDNVAIIVELCGEIIRQLEEAERK